MSGGRVEHAIFDQLKLASNHIVVGALIPDKRDPIHELLFALLKTERHVDNRTPFQMGGPLEMGVLIVLNPLIAAAGVVVRDADDLRCDGVVRRGPPLQVGVDREPGVSTRPVEFSGVVDSPKWPPPGCSIRPAPAPAKRARIPASPTTSFPSNLTSPTR